MKGFTLAVGIASLLTATGVPLATPVSAAPTASEVATSAPAQLCLPLPGLGLACGLLGIIPGVNH
jgi:hypothetical protein